MVLNLVWMLLRPPAIREIVEANFRLFGMNNIRN